MQNFIFLVFLTVISCSKQTTTKVLTSSQQITIPFVSGHTAGELGITIIDSTSLFLKLNRNTQSVLSYNSSTGDSSIYEIGDYGKFYFVGGLKDSLAIGIPRFGNKFILINLKSGKKSIFKGGDLLVKRGEPVFEVDTLELMLRSYFEKQPTLCNEKVLIHLTPYGSGDEGYLKFPNILAWNIETKEYIFFGNYPSFMDWEENWFGLQGIALTIVCGIRDEVIINFPMDEKIHVYDNKQELKKTILVKSKYLGDMPPKPLRIPENEDSNKYKVKYLAEKPMYYNLLKDKVKNIYYRVVLHEMDFIDEEGMVKTFEHKPWSVIVTNKNFEVIGEHYFSPGTFDFRRMYAGLGGLWIKESNSNDFHKFELNADLL